MNALNFLFEKPGEGWLDFLVGPERLVAALPKAGEAPASKDSEVVEGRRLAELLGEALERARWEERECALNKQGLDPQLLSRRADKVSRLWRVAWALAESAQWSGDALRASAPITSLLEMMDKYVREAVGGGRKTGSVEELLEGVSPGSSSGLANYAAGVYCRVLLSTASFLRAPRAAPSVAAPLASLDAARTLFGAKEMASLVARAAALLQQLLAAGDLKLARLDAAGLLDFPTEAAVPLPSAFESPGEPMERADAARFLAALRWALLDHCFLDGRLGEAKMHAESLAKGLQTQTELLPPAKVACLRGYCAALGLQGYFEQRADVSVRERQARTEAAASSSAASADALLLSGRSSAALSTVALGRLARKASPPVAAAAEGAARLRRRAHLSRRLAAQLAEPPIWAHFQGLVTEHLNGLTDAESAEAAADWLANLARMEPQLKGRLAKAFPALAAFFQPAAAQKKPVKKEVAAEELAVVTVRELRNSGPEDWRLCATGDYQEMKVVVHQRGQLVLPCRLSLPSTLEEVFNQIPGGSNYDFLALVCSRAQQLARAGLPARAKGFLGQVEREPGMGNPNLKQAFHLETLRLELVEYQELVFRTAELGQIQRWRLGLGPKVKELVRLVAAQRDEDVVRMGHMEALFRLATSFLLNMGEWEYVTSEACGRFRSPHMDLAKLLAAYCLYAEDRKRRFVAQSLWDVLLPTMSEPPPKRAADGSRIPQPHLLISKAQLRALLEELKEPGALALLVGFLARLLNALELPGATKVSAEAAHLLPTGAVPGTLSGAFVKECLGIALRNALLGNPSNAFVLRTAGDFALCSRQPQQALRYYVQALQVSSCGLAEALAENVADGGLVEGAVRAARALGADSEAALLAQLHPPLLAELNATTWPQPSARLFPLIWDSRLAEVLVSILDAQDSLLLEEEALRALAAPDLNPHNGPDVAAKARQRRQTAFLSLLAERF